MKKDTIHIIPEKEIEKRISCLQAKLGECNLPGCLIQELLKPGELPSRIFEQIYDKIIVPESFESNFMGFGGNQVQFLGHGIGLVVDEFPALTKKIDYPLK